jgi:hypothetical protein
MLNVISQTQKNKYVFTLICCIKKKDILNAKEELLELLMC